MERNLITLGFILTYFLCPFLAYADSIDGAWKRDLIVLSAPAKLNSLQNLLKMKTFTINELDDQKTLKSFIQKLHEKSESLEKQSSGGVDSGGGGNLVLYKNGDLKLLDFVANPLDSNAASRRPLHIPSTASLQAWGIDRLQLDDFAPKSFFMAKISAWESSSPFMAEILKQAISSIPIYIVDYEFKVNTQSYFLPSSARSPSIKGIVTAAIYVRDYGVLVSKKYFEHLDFENQVGLILHETLRHIQLTYGYANSNRSLQQLTAALMRGPRRHESLDSAEYLDGKLLHSIVARAELEAFAISAIPEGCLAYEKALKKSCPIKNLNIEAISQVHNEMCTFIQTALNRTSQEIINWVYDKSQPLMQLIYLLSIQNVSAAVQLSQDAAIDVNKSISTNALDVISKNFNERGYFWSPYKSEARLIIKNLKEAGIFR